RDLAHLEKRLKAINDDQVRLRANIERRPNTPAYKRYLERLDTQETQIEKLQGYPLWPSVLREDDGRRLLCVRVGRGGRMRRTSPAFSCTRRCESCRPRKKHLRTPTSPGRRWRRPTPSPRPINRRRPPT